MPYVWIVVLVDVEVFVCVLSGTLPLRNTFAVAAFATLMFGADVVQLRGHVFTAVSVPVFVVRALCKVDYLL